VSNSQTETRVLSIYVGSTDKTLLERLLQNYLFRDLEIVADSWRRSDPEEYSAWVSLQAMLNEKSTAICMTEISSDLREYLRDCRMHSPIAVTSTKSFAPPKDPPTPLDPNTRRIIR
jgi:hypothetical protein